MSIALVCLHYLVSEQVAPRLTVVQSQIFSFHKHLWLLFLRSTAFIPASLIASPIGHIHRAFCRQQWVHVDCCSYVLHCCATVNLSAPPIFQPIHILVRCFYLPIFFPPLSSLPGFSSLPSIHLRLPSTQNPIPLHLMSVQNI